MRERRHTRGLREWLRLQRPGNYGKPLPAVMEVGNAGNSPDLRELWRSIVTQFPRGDDLFL
jgi:hypothetical protein